MVRGETRSWWHLCQSNMVDSSLSLKHGSIMAIINKIECKPNLQIVDIQKRSLTIQGCATERYRVVLSDGQYYIQGMLATHLVWLVNNGSLLKFTIIKVTDFICERIAGKPICIVIECNVIKQMNKGIGKPIYCLKTQSKSKIHLFVENSINITYVCIFFVGLCLGMLIMLFLT